YLLMAAHATLLVASAGFAFVTYFEGPVWTIFVFLALAGCGRALGMPTRTSLIPNVVPLEAIANAVMWTSSGWQVVPVAGSSVGGLLIALLADPAVVYQTTAVGLIVCIAIVTLMQPRPVELSTEPRSLATLLAGIRFVWKSELLLAAITLDLFAVLL